MKRFEMHRREDETGVSGTGHVADGALFDDGIVVIHWRTSTPGTTVFSSLDDAKAVHGHDGKTSFVFRDAAQPGEREIYFCSMCFAESDLAFHCHNCGAGGTNVSIPIGHAELIRKSASWVGKRYYPSDDDKAERAEIERLRLAIGTWPGRTVKASSLANEPEHARRVDVEQKTEKGWTQISTERADGETDEQIIRRTAAHLPWIPETETSAMPDGVGLLTTTVTQMESE